MAITRLCSVEGCGKPHHRQGLCSAHSKRMARRGNFDLKRAPKGTTLKWLKDHIDYAADACLIWPFYKQERGVGTIRLNGKVTSSYVAMCILVHGPRPSKFHEAAHSCGKRHIGCVHPMHLRWATREENKADMTLHGTDFRGERSPNHKLSESDARYIKEAAGLVSSSILAERFGVSRSTVKAIWSKRLWAWLCD